MAETLTQNLGVSRLNAEEGLMILGAGIVIFVLIAVVAQYLEAPSIDKFFLTPYIKFAYASFLKPHTGRPDGGQQSALESFYSAQASVYDATRKQLLHGREDMLGCVAAQLRLPLRRPEGDRKPVWFDIGGGTGYNIEVMDKLVGLQDFFEHVYLIDLSPSLCEIARQRIKQFGWTNVTVLCEDARLMHSRSQTADLITMSYSLSMIPDFYSVVDQVTTLLAPQGVIGICDFYVQSIVDISSRNWTGGSINRHVNWLGRMFWRTWFDADRVNLDSGRRDYIEYRFGTILSASERNYVLGGIPYYIFIGCHISAETTRHTASTTTQDALEKLNAQLTESPYLSPQEYREALSTQSKALPMSSDDSSNTSTPVGSPIIRSKTYESALVNLSSNLPLPSAFYQYHHWRTTYSDLLPKHAQFAEEYIYAFNWEDPAVDLDILNIKHDDVIVTITSAGDNILDYLSQARPKRVHAIDLNPNQNHLLELKCASFAAGLSHAEIWSLFGEGTMLNFRDLLIHRLSPHLSSNAFQFWLSNGSSTFSPRGLGLYASSGGSRHAITLCRWLFRLFKLGSKVRTMCSVSTLAEQKEIWYNHLRPILLSRPLHALLVSTEWWAWKAAGVPPEQRQLIVDDYEATLMPEQRRKMTHKQISGEAVFKFLEDTLDPVINHTLLSSENYFYHVVLNGRYSKACAPRWLGQREYRRLTRGGGEIFDGLRIHTDEFLEVVRRMRGGSVGIVILMDSMDWFTPPEPKNVKFEDSTEDDDDDNNSPSDPSTRTTIPILTRLRSKRHNTTPSRSRSQSKSRSTEGTLAAASQIEAVHRVLKVGGRVLLRSAALRPWYIDLFARLEDESTGAKLWQIKCMGRREGGKCIDRVNMYASCWLLVKIGESTPISSPPGSPRTILKRRRTGSGESSGSTSSLSTSAYESADRGGFADGLRGRKMGQVGAGARHENEDEGIDARVNRGVLEDIMLPGAALDQDAALADRF